MLWDTIEHGRGGVKKALTIRSVEGTPTGSVRRPVRQRRIAIANRFEVCQAIIARDVSEIMIRQPGAGNLEDVAIWKDAKVPQPRSVVSRSQ